MSLKERVQGSFNIIVSISALLSTFYTVVELMLFLSNPSSTKVQKYSGDDLWISASWSLFVNQILLSVFLLQHSILALPEVKNWLSSRLKLQVLQRSVYVILTSLSLQMVIKYWHAVPEVTLWSINTNVRLYWWAFITLHAFAWLVIYVGTICMDINELLGVKQVYYSIQHFPEPNTYKSAELKRLYAHMRHPSYLGFIIILWGVPYMSVDRLLLAIIWTTYMYIAWKTDQSDCLYQKLQFAKKFHEFNYVN